MNSVIIMFAILLLMLLANLNLGIFDPLMFNTVILIAFSVILYFVYISVIKKKNKLKEAFSCVNVQLKKRYDLIPNILTLANEFMEHEKSLMEEIAKLRTTALSIPENYENVGKRLDLDNQINSKLQELFVSVENYPQLKSDKTMLFVMQSCNDVEEHIAAARRFFNSAVNDLNNAVEIFPYSLFAKSLGIKSREFFQIDNSETKSIDASKYF